MKHRVPPMLLLLVLVALVGGGVVLSRASRPRVSRTGEMVVPIAWTQPVGTQPAPQLTAPAQQYAPQQLSPALDRLRPPAPSTPAYGIGAGIGNGNGGGRRVMGFLQFAPAIYAGDTPPHGNRGDCKACHRIMARPAAATAATPAATAAPCPMTQAAATGNLPTTASGNKLPYQEAHWQGIEAISLTPGLARVMKISPTARGVVIDEVTWPADEQGLAAGDLILSVGMRLTPDLESLVAAADRVRDESRVMIEVLRNGETKKLQLSARRLGNAVGETAPMIPPGARPPHGYMGPCTDCHRIGRGGSLPVDLGDVLSKAAPPIRAGQPRPHLDRGACSVCHQITQ